MNYTLIWTITVACLGVAFYLGSIKNSVDTLIETCDNNFRQLNKLVLDVAILKAKKGT